jgi:hypothetical protein
VSPAECRADGLAPPSSAFSVLVPSLFVLEFV